VTTLTVGGTIEAGDLFVVTMNGKAVSVAAASTVAAEVAELVQAALDASEHPEFMEVDWTVDGAVVTGTAATAGIPFTATATTTESNGSAADDQTFSASTTTSNQGPNDWSTAANWSGAAVPVNSDDVYLDTPIDILYGLAQSAVTLTSLTIPESFAQAKLGLPEHAGDYSEYRGVYLAIGATTITVRCQSSRLKIDTGSVATTLNVQSTGQGEQTGLEALLWKGTSASNVVNITKGQVGIAVLGGETANVSGGFRIGYESSVTSDAQVRCGTGVTFNAINKQGGKLMLASNSTALTQLAGETTILAGAHTAINLDGGRLYYQSTGTVTALNLSNDGIADFTRDLRARTVSACDTYGSSWQIIDSYGTVTWTAGIDLDRGNDLSGLKLGNNIRISVGSVA
jgi:hypothetical protein